MQLRRHVPARRWLPTAAFALAAVGLVAAAVLMDRSLRQDARRRAGEQLASVASLKASAVARWRDDRARYARFAAAYAVIGALARETAHGGATPGLLAHARDVLGRLAAWHGDLRVALLTADARPLVDWAAPDGPAAPLDAGLVSRALRSADGAATELRVDPEDRPYLDVAVAVAVDGEPRCALFLRAEAASLFSSVIESWPVPTETATAALVLTEGERIRIFVPPHDNPGAPPVLRLSLSDVERPAVKAALGGSGIIEGRDLHGSWVLVAVEPVAGTPWAVHTKMALREIERPVGRAIGIVALLVAALLLAGGTLLGLWWRHERERAAMEARIQESQERFELALAGTHHVWDWDLERGVFRAEADWAAPAGSPPVVLEGTVEQVVAGAVHPDDVPEVLARTVAHLRGEAPVFESEHRVPPQLGLRWVLARGSVSRRDEQGNPTRFTGVLSDVTERRSMQAQLERAHRLAGLGTLAAGVAHEINNPLLSVTANLDFLAARLGRAPDPAMAQALADACDGAERVRDVVRGLKAFSSPGDAARAPTDVRDELEAAVRLARNEIRHRARLEVRIGALPPVEAGAHELGQVFLNVLVNAAHAIPEGHAEENCIRVDARTDAGGRACVEIRDTGVGIPRHVLDRIFEPFFTTKPLGVGTGLGLAIAHGIVRNAGGRIDVESEVGRGTLFRITLPPAAAPTATPPPPAVAPRGAGPRRLLVVDDDALVVRAVTRSLQRDYAIEAASSGPEALARIVAGEQYDLLLCDLMMPQMTGMEFHARLAAQHPALAPRVVFMTGGAFTEAAARFLRETSNACVEKPFDAATLREAIARTLAA